MPQKRKSPSKRANAARAVYHTTHKPKLITPSSEARIFRSRVGLHSSSGQAYSSNVAANSVTGFGDPYISRRTSAHHQTAGAFFVPAVSCYGGCARETFGSAGCLESRFANLRTAATLNRLATVRGSSSTLGAIPMMCSHALNPSARSIRATAHKAMALAALHANSSLASRLTRYNHHMQRARALEAQEVCHV